MNGEEKKAIEYYQGKEFSFEIEGNMEELKKALGITDNEEDSFESHQIRIQTLLNLIDRLQKDNDFLKQLYLGTEEFIRENYVEKDKIKEIIYPTPENYIPIEVQTSNMYKRIEDILKEN